jgi:hypothetical protein
MSRRIIPPVPGYNKVDVVSYVKMMIKSNAVWARRACIVLYDQQTKIERRNHLSSGHNQCGFGRMDSPLLSKIACRIKQNRDNADDHKTLQRKLSRYAGQLICLAYDKDNYKTLKKQLDYYYRNQELNLPY